MTKRCGKPTEEPIRPGTPKRWGFREDDEGWEIILPYSANHTMRGTWQGTLSNQGIVRLRRTIRSLDRIADYLEARWEWEKGNAR